MRTFDCPPPVDQFRIEVFFKLEDMGRESRLGNVDGASRFTEVQGLREFNELPDDFDVHIILPGNEKSYLETRLVYLKTK